MPSIAHWAASSLAAAAFAAHAASALPALNVDKTQVSVSGLSSGGFMADQLGYAYSSTFMGVGVFAGGPYMCAGHNNYTACMYNASIGASQLGTMQTDLTNWSGSSNDALSNVARQKVFLWVGSADTTVGPNPMTAVRTQYTNNGVTSANLSWNQLSGANHTFPTDFAGSGDNACGTAASPYISNCGFDGAGAMFRQFYGTLNARNDAPASANYVQFDQTAYDAGNAGMASTGWIYVPASCASGTSCRLHVALHGCLQSYSQIGANFLQNTGYTRWADTNNIIVLFPQTQVDNGTHATADSGSLSNPNACWDWIGWYGSTFAQKAGAQMKAIKSMVDAISAGSTGSGGGGGGGGGSGALAAPSGVTASGATANSMTIAWNAVSGASGYNVYRNGAKVTASPVTGTSWVDTGLAAGTSYSWTVTDLNASGGTESAPSSAAAGTTTGGTPATCFTANNYAHVQAGRAHQAGGYAYANGSNQNMGLWNLFVTTTLKQTGTNYYVIGTCP